MKSIFVIDDEKHLTDILVKVLNEEGYRARAFYDAVSAIDSLKQERPDMILLDIRMPVVDGYDALRTIRSICPEVKIIIITANARVDKTRYFLENGACDFVAKPFNLKEIRTVVKQALSKSNHADPVITSNRLRIIGQSPQIQACVDTALKLSNSDAPMFITGETGTGKEMLAEFIHYNSIRKYNNLVKINCAAIPNELLEGELFGFEKGAFTGATYAKPGKLEMSHDGTLFLDEIADMDTILQAKLLRILEYKHFERLGSNRPIKTDFRLICATNKHISEEMLKGKFREDLYYRLNTITINIPPLRERSGDVELLARHFIDKYREQYAVSVTDISPEAVEILKKYPWPGNVRELRNTIYKLVLLTVEPVIMVEDLPANVLNHASLPSSPEPEQYDLNSLESRQILKALQQTKGNKKEASRLLGISERTLYYKLKRLQN